MHAVIGLDIGTTSTIGVTITAAGETLAHAARPTTLSAPRPGWAEEDPAQWWDNVCAVTREMLAASGLAPSAVRAVAVTGMLPAVVLLDAEGRVLRPAIQQSDGRCGREVAALRAELDEAAFCARVGNGINQQLVAAKLRWVARCEPEVFARVATVFGSYDYVNHRLTGERRAERNWALEAGFLDAEAGTPADDLIALGGLERDTIPPLVRSDEAHGRVTAAAAAATGLAAGTLVMGGAADHVASAYAAGVLEPGDVLLKFGGAADILTAAARYAPDPRMFLDHHLVPGLWMPNGCMATGGVALNWFADAFGAGAPRREGETIHAALDRLAAEVSPGADGVMIVPYFLGEKTPLHDVNARGVVSGLSLSHGLGHLWRALLEGYGYAFRHHVEVLREMGCPARRFIASDGGARSRVWMQAVANILQAEIALLEGHPGSCLGAAWTAAIGAGLSDDWGGVARFVRHGETVRPDAAAATVHEAGYRRFRETYERLRGMDGAAA